MMKLLICSGRGAVGTARHPGKKIRETKLYDLFSSRNVVPITSQSAPLGTLMSPVARSANKTSQIIFPKRKITVSIQDDETSLLHTDKIRRTKVT